jgi:hypothetical protein
MLFDLFFLSKCVRRQPEEKKGRKLTSLVGHLCLLKLFEVVVGLQSNEMSSGESEDCNLVAERSGHLREISHLAP